MKAKAPEKIYVEISHPFGKDEYTQMVGFEDKVNSDDVEYVRADAFIEKACEWLKENITNNPNANSVLVRNGCVTLGMLVDDFKKYMERE